LNYNGFYVLSKYGAVGHIRFIGEKVLKIALTKEFS